MKANLKTGAALWLALGVLAGCTTTTPPRTIAEAQPLALAQCDSVTGSRIRTRQRAGCKPLGYPSKTFTAEDLDSTGEIDLADALRQLDPAFR